MEDVFDVIWRDKKVGRIENYRPDMWYLEGNWVSENTDMSKEFETLVMTFDAKKVMDDERKGTRAILKTKDSDTEVHALIISLTDGLLFLRRIYAPEAVKSLIRNVK